MKILWEAGLLHGDCLTVTGNTLAENLANVAPYPDAQQIIRPLSNPIKKDSHLVILRGNLAPEGAVAKITGHEGLSFSGTARCFTVKNLLSPRYWTVPWLPVMSLSYAMKDLEVDLVCGKCCLRPVPSAAEDYLKM